MHNYNILVLYTKCDAFEPDEQLIMMCKAEAYGVINTQSVLQQFKYCLQNGIRDDRYCVLRKYLQAVCGNNIVKKLEAM